MSRLFIILTMLLAAAGALSSAAAQAPDGKTIFDKHCKKCHGVLGSPPQAMKKKYPKVVSFDAKFVASHTEDSVVTILTRGKSEDMVSFKMKLSPEEMATVAKYVRELGSNAKPELGSNAKP
jgi:mono/diheme cytochrome c family protein